MIEKIFREHSGCCNAPNYGPSTLPLIVTSVWWKYTQLGTKFLKGFPGERVSEDVERGKRDVYCDKQVEKAVTVLNYMLKGSWGEIGSRGIRKKLKCEYTAYLESKFRRNDRGSI